MIQKLSIFIAICKAASFFPTWSLVIILCILDIVQIIMIVVNFVAEMAVSSYQLIQSPLNANIKKDKEY